MVSQPSLCRYCESSDVERYGTQSGSARFKCKHCGRIFKIEYIYRACEPNVKEHVMEMTTNGRGVRDTARVSGIAKNTVITTVKKFQEVVTVNSFLGSRQFAIEIRQLVDSPIISHAQEPKNEWQ